MQWILASASPRRKELFAELVKDFEIIPAKGEETLDPTLSYTPAQLVSALAAQKAEEVALLPCAKGKAVLGADTVVAFEGEVLGKPKDEADARRMLTLLSGRRHEVYTGVCVLYPNKDGYDKTCEVVCTKVYFNPLTSQQITAYILSGSPMDKAGAYGIQDGGLVERIEGSFSNVVGLPIEACKEIIDAYMYPMKEKKHD
ncbi:MAG: septum formation protein Maf [Clostridia bacterium]|nr:septum formation protein Maf [Clostridia bacterium]